MGLCCCKVVIWLCWGRECVKNYCIGFRVVRRRSISTGIISIYTLGGINTH